MKLTHKQKIKLANKMISPEERKKGVSIWRSMGWQVSKFLKFNELKDQMDKGEQRREVRKNVRFIQDKLSKVRWA